MSFESGDFCIETGASGQCGGTANVYWGGFNTSGPTGSGCFEEGYVEIPHVKELRIGSGLHFSDYVEGDCCSGGYVEISSSTLSLTVSGSGSCCSGEEGNNGALIQNVTNINLGEGLNVVGGASSEECEGGSVTISACVPTIAGTGCEGSSSGQFSNLNIGYFQLSFIILNILCI